jgi:hypothetical protein
MCVTLEGRIDLQLGIHLAIDNPDLDAKLPKEVRELRVRLYWSGEPTIDI